MGRETKLLLGLLATLFGVFLGVLSMKLLVPRPPAGAGPDVHTDVASTEPQTLVEPPRFADELPSMPDASAESPPGGRFASRPPDDVPPRDPAVTHASFESSESRRRFDPPHDAAPQPLPVPVPPADRATMALPPPTPGGGYVARPGDSWWSLAEAVYGDGRLYRAVFAWNRAIDARVSLVPGTAIELPPRDRLEAAWPALVPSR